MPDRLLAPLAPEFLGLGRQHRRGVLIVMGLAERSPECAAARHSV
jgi:hypothetical protein